MKTMFTSDLWRESKLWGSILTDEKFDIQHMLTSWSNRCDKLDYEKDMIDF